MDRLLELLFKDYLPKSAPQLLFISLTSILLVFISGQTIVLPEGPVATILTMALHIGVYITSFIIINLVSGLAWQIVLTFVRNKINNAPRSLVLRRIETVIATIVAWFVLTYATNEWEYRFAVFGLVGAIPFLILAEHRSKKNKVSRRTMPKTSAR